MGTSASYSGPNWPATNDAVNAATQGGSIGGRQSVAGAVSAFARDSLSAARSSGSESGGGGGGHSGISSSARAGVGLAGFVSAVRSSGLNSALEGVDLSDAIGGSVEDICDAISDALVDQDGFLDNASMRDAMSRTLEELCSEAQTAEELEALLGSDGISLNEIVAKFYCNALQVNFENKEWNKVQERLDSADQARDFFQQSKEYIEGFVEYRLSKEVDLTKFDLSGPEGLAMAERLNQEVLEALGHE